MVTSKANKLNVHVCVYSDPVHCIKLYGLKTVEEALKKEIPHSCTDCMLYDTLLQFLKPLVNDKPCKRMKPDGVNSWKIETEAFVDYTGTSHLRFMWYRMGD